VFCFYVRTIARPHRKITSNRLGFPSGCGEIHDQQQAAEILLRAIQAQVLRGERRTLMLSNRAIDAYRQQRQAVAA